MGFCTALNNVCLEQTPTPPKKKKTQHALHSYLCPCSSIAVPLRPPMSHMMMEWSELPENRTRWAGSQHSAVTLPEQGGKECAYFTGSATLPPAGEYGALQHKAIVLMCQLGTDTIFPTTSKGSNSRLTVYTLYPMNEACIHDSQRSR